MNENLKRTAEEWEGDLSTLMQDTQDWTEVAEVRATVSFTLSLRTNHAMVEGLAADDPEGLAEAVGYGMKSILDAGFVCGAASTSWGAIVPTGEALMLLERQS